MSEATDEREGVNRLCCHWSDPVLIRCESKLKPEGNKDKACFNVFVIIMDTGLRTPDIDWRTGSNSNFAPINFWSYPTLGLTAFRIFPFWRQWNQNTP